MDVTEAAAVKGASREGKNSHPREAEKGFHFLQPIGGERTLSVAKYLSAKRGEKLT